MTFQDPYRPHSTAGADTALVPAKAADVVAWVGDDEVRARSALDVERQRRSPRKTVLDHLAAVAPHLT